MIKVTVWNEYGEKQKREEVAKVYPAGIHAAIAEFLDKEKDIEVKTSTLQDDERGLSQALLDGTDVLIYWAHCYHDKVSFEDSARVVDAVNRGMGVIFLHSAHKAKPFTGLLGTSGYLEWREAAEKERLFVTEPGHEIAAGLPLHFEIEHEEMYGEPFDIPNPEATVFIGWYKGGNVFRSGVCYTRGRGRVFYFQPGHETYGNYYLPNIQRVIVNAVRWASPRTHASERNSCPNVAPLEEI
ncbi:MAG: ThuA domain-containing protein [Clostridiales bacterium]|jgi:trehalose utilization protein|nr:ThuA domain-containing protein [Clostridiales bacterium]